MIGSQMRKLMPLCILVFAASGLAGPTSRSELAKPDGDKLIVHEWGTYLSVQGSDGVTLGGFRCSVGAGVRVALPMLGPVPLAFDFGVPVVRQQTDITQVFSFYVGLNR